MGPRLPRVGDIWATKPEWVAKWGFEDRLLVLERSTSQKLQQNNFIAVAGQGCLYKDNIPLWQILNITSQSTMWLTWDDFVSYELLVAAE